MIILAQALPQLPPDTPWFIVVVVVIIFLCAPFISKVIDKKFEVQEKLYQTRIEQIRSEAAESASTSKTIDTLVNTLERFTNAMNSRDAREFEERALFRETIGKNTQGLSGVELAMRTMASTLIGVKEHLDRWPIDFKQIMLEAISESEAKQRMIAAGEAAKLASTTETAVVTSPASEPPPPKQNSSQTPV